MRDDMSKVIVERPRLRRSTKSMASGGRQFRDDVEPDDDGGHAPHRLGMKAGYRNRKWLNENLAPLRRWLQSQVNRPWDKVYSELCANIDRRNTVQEHIFAHIEQSVAVKTRMVDGEVLAPKWWGPPFVPVGESRVLLFVHPVTGILLPNRARLKVKRKRAEQTKRKAEAAVAGRRIVGKFGQLHLVDGIWYLVTLAILPQGVPSGRKDRNGQNIGDVFEKRWDVLRRQLVSRADLCGRGHSACSTYGRHDLYAVRKRQLRTKELQHYGLTNKAGIPGLVVFGPVTLRTMMTSCGSRALRGDRSRISDSYLPGFAQSLCPPSIKTSSRREC